ncbi:MAG: acyltransferase [Alphaproteobacteria bacterium]|nr:acyltransferase [Alphaproteobacteria bacterium]
MNRETSIYLDGVRFTAAAVVFLTHVSGRRLTGGLFWQVAPYGSEAVTLFFVLSGFVIGYTTRRNRPAETYIVARTARIYSVALPALLLTFVLDSIGRGLNPALYTESWGYIWDGRAWQFLRGALFLNQIWYTDVSPGSDLPYWSLGYEVWYYAIFGVAAFSRSHWRWPILLGLLAFVGPRIAGMFPLWALGFLAYRVCSRVTLSRGTAVAMCLGAVLIWVAYEAQAWMGGTRMTGAAPAFLGHPELAQSYLVATLFTIHLIGFHSLGPTFGVVLNRFARPVRWIAGATFSLYLFHVPIAQFIAALMPWSPSSGAARVAVLIGTPLLVLALAEVTERRKESWRRLVIALLRYPSSFWSGALPR